MKKLTIEATEANVLDSIEHDTLQRTSDVREFLMMIDNIDCIIYYAYSSIYCFDYCVETFKFYYECSGTSFGSGKKIKRI